MPRLPACLRKSHRLRNIPWRVGLAGRAGVEVAEVPDGGGARVTRGEVAPGDTQVGAAPLFRVWLEARRIENGAPAVATVPQRPARATEGTRPRARQALRQRGMFSFSTNSVSSRVRGAVDRAQRNGATSTVVCPSAGCRRCQAGASARDQVTR